MPAASSHRFSPGDDFNISAQSERAAQLAAGRAGVRVGELTEMAALQEVSRLFESVWGRSPEGVPLHSELLRSLVHAGGCVIGAHDVGGSLVGGAALVLAAPAGATYSLIAAAAPASNDRGVGQALKQAQRAWALARGLTTMSWTFDPLVGRNARFNLVKLGATATAYEVAFYGRMGDEINGDDDADRLVARWELGSRRAVAASEGTAPEVPGPDLESDVLRDGPDGDPMVRRDARGLWCRIPLDVVALRRSDPRQANAWRTSVRDVLAPPLAAGASLTQLTRDGWYLVTSEERA